jgi:hypothetical protein
VSWHAVTQVRAVNKAGEGPSGEKLAIRTLAKGAADMTPWAETVDDASGKIIYVHARSGAVASNLPKGALVDPIASFRCQSQ